MACDVAGLEHLFNLAEECFEALFPMEVGISDYVWDLEELSDCCLDFWKLRHKFKSIDNPVVGE